MSLHRTRIKTREEFKDEQPLSQDEVNALLHNGVSQ